MITLAAGPKRASPRRERSERVQMRSRVRRISQSTAPRLPRSARQIAGQLALFAAAGEAQEDVLEAGVAGAGALAQLGQRARGDQRAGVDDRHAVAELLGDLQHMGGE